MKMVYGEIILAGAILLFLVALIGARNPRKRVWNAPFLVENVYPIAVIAMGFCGLFMMTTAIYAMVGTGIDLKTLFWSVAIWGATVLLILQLKVRRRISAYERDAVSDNIIDFSAKTRTDGGTPPKKAA